MAEKFLTLMADFDDNSQKRMSEWYVSLKNAGFIGTQTANLPYHISLATFPLDQEQEAVGLTQRIASEFAPFPVHISHIGMFAGGKVLFGAPERTPMLDALHNACDLSPNSKDPWTPHATILIDEPEAICSALSLFVKLFYPFVANITKLHLCAFWPTRDIISIELNGDKAKK